MHLLCFNVWCNLSQVIYICILVKTLLTIISQKETSFNDHVQDNFKMCVSRVVFLELASRYPNHHGWLRYLVDICLHNKFTLHIFLFTDMRLGTKVKYEDVETPSLWCVCVVRGQGWGNRNSFHPMKTYVSSTTVFVTWRFSYTPHWFVAMSLYVCLCVFL